MTKRRVERLLEQAKENNPGGYPGDGGDEVAVELAGVPARGPDEDGGPPTTDDGDGFESFSVDLDSGEVETPGFPDPADCPECSTADCENPALPEEFGVSSLRKCGTCLGIPDRDVPPAFRDAAPDGGEVE